ncbi:MAG: phosphatidate cytidylyltransferase [Syntrophobacteraceae bacterium]|nr:phosphatidate cytidylyltransferase [Syntrophobacteraceae bacterium]
MSETPKSHSSKLRWITGILLGLPVLACVLAGPHWVGLALVLLAVEIGLWELHGLLLEVAFPAKWKMFSYAAGLFIPYLTYRWGVTGLNSALFLSLFSALTLMMISAPLDRDEIGRIAMLSFAWLYVPYLLSFVLLLWDGPNGRYWILFLLAVIVAGDSGAYFTGLKMGTRKLYPTVSPKKTVEGSLGGLCASLVTGVVLGLIFLRNVPLASLCVFSLAVAVAGQVGDLIESMIKRNSGKKDSSGLLPGHGGLLDRLDSLLFAFPVLWALLRLSADGLQGLF